MPSSLESHKHVSVFETTLSIQRNTLSVFNIVIQSSQSTVSLIRYPFDLVEFHQKIRFHYPKIKISFPTLNNPSKKSKALNHSNNSNNNKRRSLRDLLPFSKKRSNSDKVEKYLQRCFEHPIIRISSILKDFTSVQRDEDALLTSQHTSTTLTPTLNSMRKDVRSSEGGKEQQGRSEPQELQPIFLLPPSSTPVTTSIAPITLPDSMTKIEKRESLLLSDPINTSIDDFSLLKVLGKGCMGKVLLVRSKRNNQLSALKSIKKDWVIQQKEIVHTLAEREILVRLRGQPFLVHLQQIFQTSSQLFLVLDYYPGGDIATQLSVVTSFSEERTRFYAAEIIYGLKILHEHGIVYRDLKPENVLIGKDGHIVLADFGLSKIFSEKDVDEYNVPSTRTFCGTAEYLAPEILLGEKYTFVVDFWSLGTLLYEMLAGTTPFWADNHMDMYKRVLEDELEFPPSFDTVTCNFLTGLLEKEACERLGWGEDGIEDIMLHPYFSSIDWNIVPEKKLIPPYTPKIKNDTDLTHFDPAFTNLPVRVSTSSSANYDSRADEDPFQHFSFHPDTNTAFTTTITMDTSSSTNNRVKKRHSAVLFNYSSTGGNVNDGAAGPSSTYAYDNHNSDRVVKKRQIISQNSLSNSMHTPSISSTMNQEIEEEESSVYSRSSLTFSFGGQATTLTRAGSELSIETTINHQPYAINLRNNSSQASSPYERPNCPIPGQRRDSNTGLPHSNASTLAHSLCSYLGGYE